MSEPWDPFSVFAYDQGQSSSAPQLPDEEPDPSDPERYKAYNLAMKAQTDERLERLKDIKKSPLYPVKKRDNEVSVPKPPMEVPESASEVIVYQAPFLRQEKFRQNMIERHERFEAAIREIPYGDLTSPEEKIRLGELAMKRFQATDQRIVAEASERAGVSPVKPDEMEKLQIWRNQ